MSAEKLLGQEVLVTGRGMTYTGRLVGYSSLSYVLHVGSQNLTLRRDDTTLTPITSAPVLGVPLPRRQPSELSDVSQLSNRG